MASMINAGGEIKEYMELKPEFSKPITKQKVMIILDDACPAPCASWNCTCARHLTPQKLRELNAEARKTFSSEIIEKLMEAYQPQTEPRDWGTLPMPLGMQFHNVIY